MVYFFDGLITVTAASSKVIVVGNKGTWLFIFLHMIHM